MAIPGNKLFGQVVTLTVGDRDFSDFRVQYRIERNCRSKPNSADIVITGLQKSTRDAISERLTPVRLFAGTTGSAGNIFTGQLDGVSHTLDGTDWNTRIEASDGRRAWQQPAFKAWRGGTPWITVVRDLAAAMGIAVPSAVAAVVSGSARGTYAVSGYAWREMDILAAQLGLQWSIQDDTLQMVQADKALQDRIVLLSADSGMIGSPRFTDPKIGRVGLSQELRRRAAIEVDAVTQPDFVPGRRISVQSFICSGDYRIDSVVHVGDSYAEVLKSTLACSAVTVGAT